MVDCPKDKILFLGKPSAIFGMTEIGLGPTVTMRKVSLVNCKLPLRTSIRQDFLAKFKQQHKRITNIYKIRLLNSHLVNSKPKE